MVYFVLGSTYFFIKRSVETIPPLYVLAFRFLMGGLLIMSLARFQGKIRPLPNKKELLSALIIGTFLFLIGVGLITNAQQYVYSYLTAIMVASVPLIVVFFDYFLLKKPIPMIRFLGVIIGIGGVAFLLYDGKSLLTSFSPAMLMILVGIISWSFATSVGHTLPVYRNSFMHSGIQMLYVGFVCFILALLFEQPIGSIIQRVSARSFFSLLYIAIIGSLSFSAYVYLIQNEPSHRVAAYAFVNPIVALILGFVFGQEKSVPFLYIGLPLSIIGLLLNFYGDLWVTRLFPSSKS